MNLLNLFWPSKKESVTQAGDDTPTPPATWQSSVSTRLQHALDEYRRVPGQKGLLVSELAERAGLSEPSELMAALDGRFTALSFTNLDKLAVALGVSSEWLKHGRGAPYDAAGEVRLSHDVDEAIDMLVEPCKRTGSPVKSLWFFRANDARGELLIVRTFKQAPLFDVWETPYVLSDDVGSSGERDQVYLMAVFRALYHRYTHGRLSELVAIKSYLIDPSFYQVSETKKYQMNDIDAPIPLRWPSLADESAWWEDIWNDAGPASKCEHWEGMQELRQKLLSKERSSS